MNVRQTDSLGRSTFHHIEPRARVRPTPREGRWFSHIARHGPQSSEFLFEATRETHRCKDTALRDMQKLRAGGFLRLPVQQRQTEKAEFNPYIYDLTKAAKEHLDAFGAGKEAVRPAGHWWHAYTVSAATSSWEILAKRQGRDFIPAYQILQRRGAELAIPIDGKRLIPDQLFAVRYRNGYRAFLLEVDRGTEPLRSGAARKSLARSIDLYAKMFAQDIHRRHYGLKTNMLSLWMFSNRTRLTAFQDMVNERAGPQAPYFLAKRLPDRLRWKDLTALYEQPWWSSKGPVGGL